MKVKAVNSIGLINKGDFQYVALVDRNPCARYRTIKGHCFVQLVSISKYHAISIDT